MNAARQRPAGRTPRTVLLAWTREPSVGKGGRAIQVARRRKGIGMLLLALWVLSLASCRSQTEPTTGQDDATESHLGRAEKEGGASQRPGLAQGLAEPWFDAIYMGDAQVGFAQTRVTKTESTATPDGPSNSTLTWWRETQMTLRRFQQDTQVRIETEQVEAESGGMVSFRLLAHVGPTPVVAEGRPQHDGFEITLESNGSRRTSSLKADSAVRGFFALERSLRAAPPRPGETRQLTHLEFLLTSVQVAQTTFHAKQWETTSWLPGQDRELLRIELTSEVGGQTLASVAWVDQQGVLYKTWQPQLNQVTVMRVDPALARRKSKRGFDVGEASVIRLKLDPSPHAANTMSYMVRTKTQRPSDLFGPSAGQSLTPIDSRTATLRIQRVTPTHPAQAYVDRKPVSDDRQANALIQSNHPSITQLAATVASAESDPWQRALKLEKLVHQLIQKKGYAQGFASAVDTLRAREGDCTEHAVLLAALSRAADLPARVATGLVYAPQLEGFGLHMWTEVWISDRWVPLDGMLGRGGVGAGHLRIAASNLAEQEPESAIFAVIKVLGELELQRSVEPASPKP